MAFESSVERTARPPLAPGQFGRGVGKGSTVEGGRVVWVGYVDEVGWEAYEVACENVVVLPRWELEWACEQWQ
jgi:hypothetical protein